MTGPPGRRGRAVVRRIAARVQAQTEVMRQPQHKPHLSVSLKANQALCFRQNGFGNRLSPLGTVLENAINLAWIG